MRSGAEAAEQPEETIDRNEMDGEGAERGTPRAKAPRTTADRSR